MLSGAQAMTRESTGDASHKRGGEAHAARRACTRCACAPAAAAAASRRRPCGGAATLLSGLAVGLAVGLLLSSLPPPPPYMLRDQAPRLFALLPAAHEEMTSLHLSMRPGGAQCGEGPRGAGESRVHLLLGSTLGFADKLSVSLAVNLRALERGRGSVFLAVDPRDAASVAAATANARQGGIELYFTNVMTLRGAQANKAGMINLLIEAAAAACAARVAGVPEGTLPGDDFLLFLDSDVVLPTNFSSVQLPALEAAAAGARAEGRVAETLWGIRRDSYGSPQEAAEGRLYNCSQAPWNGGCETHLGYFQLMHASTPHRYIEWSRDVTGSDNLFSERFAALEVLPGVVAHMGVPGSGWWGRKEHVDWSTWGDWPQGGGCPHVIQCGAGRKAKQVCWSKCER